MNYPKKKYVASSEDYMPYIQIAEIMSDDGEKMNHSTARKHLLSGIKNFTYNMLINQGMDEEIASIKSNELYKDPDYHQYLKNLFDKFGV